MISDIPTPQDFESNGLAFLNLAWDSVIDLSLNLEQSAESLAEHSEVTKEEQQEINTTYWEQAQPALAIAVALAHQGGEFLLKARIATVSPFLLLAGEPSKWPAGADRVNKSFADFKTVDAQDLIKVHDSVCANRLPDDFKGRFDGLRKLRNTVMHSVDRRRPFTARDGVLAILQISETLIGEKTWQGLRHKYENEKVNHWDPYGYSDLNSTYSFAIETLHVLDVILQPAEVRRFYDFDHRHRRYICFSCHEEYADGFVFSCQLKPNTPQATEVFCICCQQTFQVKREPCTHDDCKGNVQGPDRWDDGHCCLTCGEVTASGDDEDRQI